MRRGEFLLLGALLSACLSPNSTSLASECNLTEQFSHPVKRGGAKKILHNKSDFFFNSYMNINTDGAPNSYHPEDPYGSNGLAINTICNGSSAILPNGTKINYKKCKELVAAFKQAKKEGWTKTGGVRMNFYAIANKNDKPCIIKSDKYKGYYVSTTSVIADSEKDTCNPDRYLNALAIPFAIYPKRSGLSKRGVGKKDVAIYHNPKNGIYEFAIIGDAGPTKGLAEGSVAIAKTLSKSGNPKTRKDTYRMALASVNVLILANVSLTPPYTARNVRSRAKRAFQEWGGEARFKKCIEDYN